LVKLRRQRREELEDARTRRRLRGAIAACERADADVLFDHEAPEDAPALGHLHDTPPHERGGVPPRERGAVELDTTRVEAAAEAGEIARERAEQRGLAGAVAAEHRDHSGGLHV